MPHTRLDLYTIRNLRDVRVIEVESCDSDSVWHSLLSTSNISRKCPHTRLDLHTMWNWRDIRATEVESYDSDSVQHSLLSTSSISWRQSAREWTSMRFRLGGILVSSVQAAGEIGDHPSRLYTPLWYSSESKSHKGWLVCGVPSTYTGSWDEGISYWVWITHLNPTLRYSSKSELLYVVHSTLISLLVWIKSESHSNQLVCQAPSTYAGSRVEGMLYRVRIVPRSTRLWMALVEFTFT